MRKLKLRKYKVVKSRKTSRGKMVSEKSGLRLTVDVQRSKSMFYSNPKHKKIAEIVSISSPREAEASCRKLLRMAKNASKKEKLTIKRAMVLAANRAEASAKRKNISPDEKKELEQVAEIYRDAYRKIDRKIEV